MKKMSDLEYHYGLKMRIYPSTNQKKIIKINGNIARTVYNKMVAIDQELYKLKQVKLPIDIVKERIKELKSLEICLIIISTCKIRILIV